MKKSIAYLLILAALLTTTILSAQNSPDTGKLWINRQDALAVLAKAKKADLLEQKLSVMQRDTSILGERIRNGMLLVTSLYETISIDSSIISTYEKQIANMQQQRTVFDKRIAELNRSLRRERTKKKLTAFAGVLTTAAAFWLGMKF